MKRPTPLQPHRHPGTLPYSRAKIWNLIKDGMIPPGRPKPGDNRPHPARVWTVSEVRAMVAAYQCGTLGTRPVILQSELSTAQIQGRAQPSDEPSQSDRNFAQPLQNKAVRQLAVNPNDGLIKCNQ